MYTKRILKPIFVATLIVAALVVALVKSYSVSAKFISSSDPDMGDLQRFEGEGFSPTFGQDSAPDQYVGMGDLHLFDSFGLVQLSGHLVYGSPYLGMGDLQIFEGDGVILPIDQLASAF